MSRRRKIRGAITITIIIVIITMITMPFRHKAKVNNFCKNAEIVEVMACDGHGITHYASQFRPEWINIEEYNILIRELNNLPQSGEIYSGQIIKFYK